mmetsp:Transcript_14160/g.41548  ORF Transcript_14160/g.41548 Transcript_14160/m.41548 type:complete len:506 (-) Transcript_14160:83-1600(-)
MSRAGSAPSSLTTVDRALGGAVALGVSLATYRALRICVELWRNEKRSCPPATAVAFLSGLLNIGARAILAALRPDIGTNALEDGGEGDEYYRAAHGAGRIKRVEDANEVDRLEVRHDGSCHCGRVRFMLFGPRSLPALDCPGKIRYPHHCTKADKFEFLEGSEQHVRVYYVALDNDTKGGTLLTGGAQAMTTATVAAHTFCIQCGVHVLRAPDSSTNALEVNANCVGANVSSIGGGGESSQGEGVTVSCKVRYYEDPIGGLGSGLPLSDHSHVILGGDGGQEDLSDCDTNGEGEGVVRKEGKVEDCDEKFEVVVRNVFGMTGSQHERWRHEQRIEDCLLGGSTEAVSTNWADETGWRNGEEDASSSALKYGQGPTGETPSTSATSASDLPSLRGLELPLQHFTQNCISGEECQARKDEIHPRGGLGEVSSMLDSIDDFSLGKGSGDGLSGHRQGPPHSPQVEDGAGATLSMTAKQLRRYMKRHVGSSLSRESFVSVFTDAPSKHI